MREDGTTHLRRAKKMTIGFLSGVNKPAHEGAEKKMLKMRKSQAESPEMKMLKSVFTEALVESKVSEELYKATDDLWPLNSALREAAGKIMADNTVTDKQAALKEIAVEFINAVSTVVMSSISQVDDSPQFAWMPDTNDSSTWQLSVKTAEDVQASFDTLSKGVIDIPHESIDNVTATIKSAWEKFNPGQVLKTSGESDMSELEKYQALAKMNDSHKAYHDSLPDAEQESFRKMAEPAREVMVSMAKASDEEVTVGGQIVRKSQVPAGVFETLKKQAADLENANKTARLAKCAERVDAEFSNVAGERTLKARAVDFIEQIQDADIKGFIEATLKSHDALIKERKKPGTELNNKDGSGEDDDADEKAKNVKKFNQLVATHMETHKVSKMAAFQSVANTEEGRKLMNGEDA